MGCTRFWDLAEFWATGDLFAVILFATVHIPRQTADLAKLLAASVKRAIEPFAADGKVFA